MRKRFLLNLVAVAFGFAAHAAQTPEQLLARGQADRALALLNGELSAHANDAAALNLQCRVYFSEGQFDAAQGPCERAVAAAPGSALYHLWLGRVLGRKAEHAPALQAFGLARKTHAEFERAHQLDPRDREAAEDLGEYYVEAPRFIGGGHAKALILADETAAWAPDLAHSLRAQVAQAEKKPDVEESEWKAAGANPGALLALASFYGRQNRIPEMLATLDQAVARDAAQDGTLVSASELLTRYGQRPDQAVALLRSYLASPNQTEDAPAFRVHAQLAKLLGERGDTAGAHAELARSQSLASAFQPATKSRNGQ